MGALLKNAFTLRQQNSEALRGEVCVSLINNRSEVGVILISQPCYDLFDEDILAKSLYEYQTRQHTIGYDLCVGYMIQQHFHGV